MFQKHSHPINKLDHYLVIPKSGIYNHHQQFQTPSIVFWLLIQLLATRFNHIQIGCWSQSWVAKRRRRRKIRLLWSWKPWLWRSTYILKAKPRSMAKFSTCEATQWNSSTWSILNHTRTWLWKTWLLRATICLSQIHWSRRWRSSPWKLVLRSTLPLSMS